MSLLDGLQAEAAPSWFTSAIARAPQRSVIDVEGAALELLTWGELGKPGLLFLHGMRAHADWWSHLCPFFADRFRVASLSWSGMGRSAWRTHYSLELYQREALAALDAAGLVQGAHKPSVVAHSFSGYVAAALAAEHGERLARVVIVDSSIRPERGPWPEHPPPMIYPSFMSARARFRFAPPQESEPWVTDWIAEHALMEVNGEDGRSGWTWRFDPALYEKLEIRNTFDRLGEARCPLAFMRGERSRVVSAELAFLQAQVAPRGTPYVHLPDAAHHPMADQPLALLETLEELLQS